MPVSTTLEREAASAHTAPRMPATPSKRSGADNSSAAAPRATESRHQASARPNRVATDDEILGIDDATKKNARDPQIPIHFDEANGRSEGAAADAPEAVSDRGDSVGQSENLTAIFETNPELHQAWQDAQQYREIFSTPEEARAATALLADLDRMDTLFFSRRPEDHTELARAVANLDPASFASLAQAMAQLGEAADATSAQTGRNAGTSQALASSAGNRRQDAGVTPTIPGPTSAQVEFFHAVNSSAVEGVIQAIESQVERLLPEGVSKNARNWVVGEIYRELDATLRSNRQLTQQMREAFRSGALDADHQRALVSLVTGRARQALPGVTKRVLYEWTSTVLAANQDRRARQRAAEGRVDIAGSSGGGSDGPRPATPRDIDYTRMSDSDILNL